MLKITCIVGARPNFVKMAPLMREFGSRPNIEARLVHTGQHFSPEMSQSFFDELEIPAPDEHLGIGPGTQTEQTAEIMKALEPLLLRDRPDLLVIVGDVNSTLAAALVAAKLGIRIVHVEAGLRSFDRSMPEEVNRVVTDVLSDYLFVTEPSGAVNLQREGIPSERVFLVGNVMIDTLLRFRDKAAKSDVLDRLGLQPNGYTVVTLHRPSNVDDPEKMSTILAVLAEVAQRVPVVFPVHPRTRQRLTAQQEEIPGVLLTGPLGYLDFMHLMANARLVMTDSGGIQEETTILGVPCLTLRDNTERPVTIAEGTNQLVGTSPAAIREAALTSLDHPRTTLRQPALWDGEAAVRIADVLEQIGETK